MDTPLSELLASDLPAKKKSKAIAEALSSGTLPSSAILEASPTLTEKELAVVMESLEGATRKEPGLVNKDLFVLLIESLAHSAPRVKWEAARTIGNVAELHPEHLESAVDALLNNTSHEGTVVRWATAQALVAILRAGHADNELRDRLINFAAQEQDEGVRAVYEKGLRARRRTQ